MVFTCTDYCPGGLITTTMLDNQYDSSLFLFNQEYIFDFSTKTLYRDIGADGTKDEIVSLESSAQGYFELQLTLKSDGTTMYRYSMNTWNHEIGLMEAGSYYSPPRRLEFRTDQVFNVATDAYPGSEEGSTSHDGLAFADLTTSDFIAYEYGNLCCFDWEAKSSLIDEWGNTAWGPLVTLRKGVQLTIDGTNGDPDGDGPLAPGMKLTVAPAFTELRPLQKNDCSSTMETTLSGLDVAMPLPQPLATESERQISSHIGPKPTGVYPIRMVNGKLP